MSHDPAPGWIDRRVRAALQSEMDALRQAIDSLRTETEVDRRARQAELSETRTDLARLQTEVTEIRAIMAGLATEGQERAERVQGELHALRDELAAIGPWVEGALAERDGRVALDLGERDGRIEAVRTRLEGLMVQYRWDVEQLRQSLAVVAERLPLTD
jgi:chromosome segregation ATPase